MPCLPGGRRTGPNPTAAATATPIRNPTPANTPIPTPTPILNPKSGLSLFLTLSLTMPGGRRMGHSRLVQCATRCLARAPGYTTRCALYPYNVSGESFRVHAKMCPLSLQCDWREILSIPYIPTICHKYMASCAVYPYNVPPAARRDVLYI